MKNPKLAVTGYRKLSDQEIALMNELKELANQCGDKLTQLEKLQDTDKRSISLAKTNIQQGFMWANRAVAKPTSF